MWLGEEDDDSDLAFELVRKAISSQVEGSEDPGLPRKELLDKLIRRALLVARVDRTRSLPSVRIDPVLRPTRMSWSHFRFFLERVTAVSMFNVR